MAVVFICEMMPPQYHSQFCLQNLDLLYPDGDTTNIQAWLFKGIHESQSSLNVDTEEDFTIV